MRPSGPDRERPLDVADLEVSVRQSDGSRLLILSIARLGLPAGASAALTGPSGAGKSTLLAALSGLLSPDRGRVRWGDRDVASLSGRERDRWRRGEIGLVFQDFHLVAELDVLANILLPATFARARIAPEVKARAAGLAAAMGLPDPRRRAGLLSRGEQQRTAIARALLHDPPIILADEPTASLDAASAEVVRDLLVETAARSGATLIVATHDESLIRRLDTSWRMSGGALRGGPTR